MLSRFKTIDIPDVLSMDLLCYSINRSYDYYEKYINRAYIAKHYIGSTLVGYLLATPIEPRLRDLINEGMVVSEESLTARCYKTKSDYCLISSVAVIPQYRRKGIATQLFKDSLPILNSFNELLILAPSNLCSSRLYNKVEATDKVEIIQKRSLSNIVTLVQLEVLDDEEGVNREVKE